MRASFGEHNLTAENHQRKTTLISWLEKSSGLRKRQFTVIIIAW